MAFRKAQQAEVDYPDKYKSGIAISKAQLLGMLQDSTIFRERDINLTSQIYREKNHAATCSELALENGDTAQSYNTRVVALGKECFCILEKNPRWEKKGSPDSGIYSSLAAIQRAAILNRNCDLSFGSPL